MGFPSVDWNTVASNVRDAMTANGLDAEFTLRGSQPFTVKASWGRLADADVTGGLVQQGFRLRVHADDWDGAAAREPRKGDEVTLWGRKHAIASAWLRSAADRKIMYVMVVEG